MAPPAASNAISPKGGYNHASIYWVSPATGSTSTGDIGILSAPSSGTEYVRFGGSNATPSLMTNKIENLTSAALVIGTGTDNNIEIQRNGSTKWYVVNAGGDLVPSVDATTAIGGTGKYISALYTGGFFIKTSAFNTSVSTGVGSIKMCGGTSRNSTGFLAVTDSNGTSRYLPCFDTITG